MKSIMTIVAGFLIIVMFSFGVDRHPFGVVENILSDSLNRAVLFSIDNFNPAGGKIGGLRPSDPKLKVLINQYL